MILPFQIVKYSAEELFSVSKREKAVMCYTEKVHVVTNFIQARAAVLLDVSSVLKNQQ